MGQTVWPCCASGGTNVPLLRRREVSLVHFPLCSGSLLQYTPCYHYKLISTTLSMQLPLVYPILDTATLERCHMTPAAAAAALIEGGARILQFRHKGHFTREMFDAAKSAAALCHQQGIPFIMNDRADIALLLHAGLHLGQDDLPPLEARRIIGHSHILGFST